MTPEQKTLLETLCRDGAAFKKALSLVEGVEKQERDKAAFLTSILDYVQDAVVALDRRRRVTYWNRAAEGLYGFNREETLGRLFDTIAELDWSERDHAATREVLLKKGYWQEEVVLRRPHRQDERHISLSLVLLHGDGEEHTGELVIARDITHRVRSEEQFLFNAMHDALTGLANRSLFFSRLWKAISEASTNPDCRYAVLFLDLDRFKLVNDSFGHQTGDRLLVQIAQRLKSCLKPDDVVARMGGDEFAFLLHDVRDSAQAEQVAEEILRSLSSPFDLGEHDVFIDGSIGIVLGDGSYTRPEDLLREADIAMYRAKDVGTGTYLVFEPAMQTQVRSLLQLSTDLHHAIDRKEFVVHYQPIIQIGDGSVAGFEALVRWRHPERGLVKPAQFVPYAEETGLIIPIERWVLTQACRQLRNWLDTCPDTPPALISVNVSTRQLQQADFVDFVNRTLEETNLPPQHLVLEITEHVFMGESDFMTSGLPQLNDMHVGICIDDFGTGYSSLSKLHGLPVSIIKIDRAFTARIVDHARGLEMVRTIVNMARNLGLKVIAEGIETPAQLTLVRSLGCQYGQGFLFSPPVSTETASQLVTQPYPWQVYWR